MSETDKQIAARLAAQKIREITAAGNSLPRQMAECVELAQLAENKWRESGYGAATEALIALGDMQYDNVVLLRPENCTTSGDHSARGSAGMVPRVPSAGSTERWMGVATCYPTESPACGPPSRVSAPRVFGLRGAPLQ